MNKLIFFIILNVFGQEYRHVMFIKNSATVEEKTKISNALSNSLAFGYWINRGLNYNGIHAAQPKIAEPIAYQALRILSLFDLYLTHSTLQIKNKTHGVLLWTTMQDIQMPSYPNNFTGSFFPLLYGIFPQSSKVEIKSFSDGDIVYSPQGPKFSSTFQELLKSKAQEKLDLMWTNLEKLSREKSLSLEALNDSLLPINAIAELYLEPEGRRYYQVDMHLPGLVDIKNDQNSSNPLDWEVSPGIKKNFNPPMLGLAENLVSMGYLMEIPENERWEQIKNKLIHIRLFKDLRQWDKMELTVEFGQIQSGGNSPDNSLTLFPIDTLNRDSALKVSGYLGIRKGKILNKLMNAFKIEAFIHKLGFELTRQGKFANWQERFDANTTFSMKNRPEQTVLSLRIKKGENKFLNILPLKTMGFTCDNSSEVSSKYHVLPVDQFKYTCFADFSNVEGFKSQFIPKIGKKITRSGVGLFANLDLNNFLKSLEQVDKLDISNEKKLLENIFSLFRNNQIIIESLNFLPKEIKDFIEK